MSQKIVIDTKKIINMYNKEHKYLSKLSTKKFNDIDNKISNLKEIENEEMAIGFLRKLISATKLNIKDKQLSEIARVFKPQNFIGLNKCLKEFDSLDKMDTFNENYIGVKNGKKYHISVRKEHFFTMSDFNRLKDSIKMNKKASELKLTCKLHDIFFCNDKGILKLFIISEYADSISLDKWLETNKLTDKHKKEIIGLINNCFDHGIYIDFISSRKFLVITKGKKVSFRLAALNNAQSEESIKTSKKEYALEDLDFITSNSDEKIKSLAILKLLRERKLELR